MLAEREIEKLGNFLRATYPELAGWLTSESPADVAIQLLSQKPESMPITPPDIAISPADRETKRLLTQYLGMSFPALHNDILQECVRSAVTATEIDSLRINFLRGWEAMLDRLRLTDRGLAFDFHADPPEWVVACGGGQKNG